MTYTLSYLPPASTPVYLITNQEGVQVARVEPPSDRSTDLFREAVGAALAVLNASEPPDPGQATNPRAALTPAQDAIEAADAALSNAILPTYTELLAALKFCESAMNEAGKPRLLIAWRMAREACDRHDKTMAGNFRD